MEAGQERTMKKALIIGGNYGGLAAAVALRRAGINATVYERMKAKEDHQRGWSGVHIWTNAMRAMAELGLAEKLLPYGDPVERFEYRSWRGDVLSVWQLGDLGRKLGQPTIAIKRADLHEVLFQEVGAEQVQFGKQCAGFTQDANGVKVTFADGSEAEGDFLIAADGNRSAICKQIHGEQPLRYGGHTLFRGYNSLQHGLIDPGVMWSLWGPGGRMLINQLTPDRLSW